LRALAIVALLLLPAWLVAGCGEDESPAPATAAAEETPPASPLARIAISGGFEHSDPLYAQSESDAVIARQIYDPLVSRVDPPLGATGRRRGPARPLGPDENGDWRFEFRPGAQFHDGSPINFDAVQANVERWLASGLLTEALPEFIAVDAPEPGQIRFQLARPVPDLPAVLSAPRFGLIAPATIAANGTTEISGGAGGSGAYDPAFLGSRRAVLSAAPNWWGRAAGLGPGVRELQFLAVASQRERADLLSQGLTQIAEGLGTESLEEIQREPLLVSDPDNPNGVAASAAVRGLRGPDLLQPLSELWLTALR
jgi:peptide/nickel transport system substrate-binding protein